MNVSFLSDGKIIDDDLEEKVTKALASILCYDSHLQFYFYEGDDFALCCLEAVKKLKIKQKGHSIKAILIANGETRNRVFAHPAYASFFSEILVPPVVNPQHYWMYNHKRIERWIVEQSDFIVTYLYENYMTLDRNFLKYVKTCAQRNNIRFLDVTEEKTREKIRKALTYLPDDLRYIYQEIKGNAPIHTVAQALQLSDAKVRLYYNRACRTLYQIVEGYKKYY